MSVTEALRERARLRAAWLDRAAGVAREDDRVAALWLFGSEAVYAGHLLPIVADTYWQPASCALLGSDTRVLVDKAGLRHAEPPRPTYQLIPSVRDSRPYVPPAEPAARLRAQIEMFWSDVRIVAKHQARRWGGTDEEIGAIWTRVDDIARHLGQPAGCRGGLRALVTAMDRLLSLPEAIAVGDLKPADADDWVSVSEELLRQGWLPTSA